MDTNRSVALGMSYGGFMTDWIYRQRIGREFKAMVSKCGFANNSAQYASSCYAKVSFQTMLPETTDSHRRRTTWCGLKTIPAVQFAKTPKATKNSIRSITLKSGEHLLSLSGTNLTIAFQS